MNHIPWCEHDCMGELFIPADCVCNKLIRLMEHFIGLDYKKPYTRHERKFYKPYRNFFASGENCEGLDTLLFMEKYGLAERRLKGYTFNLTRKGLDWLGDFIGVKIYDA